MPHGTFSCFRLVTCFCASGVFLRHRPSLCSKTWILGAWLQITVELYFPLSSVLSSAMILLLCWYAVTPSFSIIKSPECRGFSIRVSFTFNKRGKWRHAVSNEKVSSTKYGKIYLRQPRIEMENLNLVWITEKRKEQLDKLIVNWPLWRVSKPDISRVSPSPEQMISFPNFNRCTWQIITHSKKDDSDSLQQI